MEPHPDRADNHVDLVDVEDEDDNNSEAAAMAAAMGFSSFGTTHHDRPAKRQRFNNHADNAGTGANNLPLLPRSAAPPPKDDAKTAESTHDGGNADGIDLGLDSDNDTPTQQSTIANIEVPANLPKRPDFPAGGAGGAPGHDWGAGTRGGGGGRGGRGGRGGGNSFKNPSWYIDYYDPSSNTNPWEHLEKAKGLEPVGTWLSFGHQSQQQSQSQSQSEMPQSAVPDAPVAAEAIEA